MGQNAHMTGWTYLELSANDIQILRPKKKTIFMVKGTFNELSLSQITVVPIGNDTYIIPINAQHRKKLEVAEGDPIRIQITIDEDEYQFDNDFIEAINDDVKAKKTFDSLSPSIQRYYSKWVASAKTDKTKSERILKSLIGLGQGLDYGATTKIKLT
jgi:hypothetical protein